MRKVSAIVLDLAREVLRQPFEKTSEPAVAVALMLTHAACNQSVEPGVIRRGGSHRDPTDRVLLHTALVWGIHLTQFAP